MLQSDRSQRVIAPEFKRIGAMLAMAAPYLQKLQRVVTELLPCSIFRRSISVLLSNGSENDFGEVFNINVEMLVQKNHKGTLTLCCYRLFSILHKLRCGERQSVP